MDKKEIVQTRIREAFKSGPSDNVYLDLSKLEIKTMPNIPTNVKILNLNFNKLTIIEEENNLNQPQFSKSVTDLFLDNNNLVNLPNLPENLEFLSCSNNKLKELPELPETIKFLDCTYNNLEKIPIVPKDCVLIFYPQEKNILEIPYGSENTIMLEKIHLGNSLVNFNEEASFGRFYKKNTFDRLETHPMDPSKKIGSKKTPKKFIARLTLKSNRKRLDTNNLLS